MNHIEPAGKTGLQIGGNSVEYLVWLTSAKRDETRNDRLAQTLAALTTGRKWIDRKRG